MFLYSPAPHKTVRRLFYSTEPTKESPRMPLRTRPLRHTHTNAQPPSKTQPPPPHIRTISPPTRCFLTKPHPDRCIGVMRAAPCWGDSCDSQSSRDVDRKRPFSPLPTATQRNALHPGRCLHPRQRSQRPSQRCSIACRIPTPPRDPSNLLRRQNRGHQPRLPPVHESRLVPTALLLGESARHDVAAFSHSHTPLCARNVGYGR